MIPKEIMSSIYKVVCGLTLAALLLWFAIASTKVTVQL